jgi:hypothetical protein
MIGCRLPQTKAERDVAGCVAAPCVDFAHAPFKIVDVHRFGEVGFVALVLRLRGRNQVITSRSASIITIIRSSVSVQAISTGLLRQNHLAPLPRASRKR